MRELAISLLYRYEGIPAVVDSDVELLTADLELVEYDARLDGPYVQRTTEHIFLRRIGGLGNLESYMKCLRTKAQRKVGR